MESLQHSYIGQVVKGVIVLEKGAALPEGVTVKVEMLEEQQAQAPLNGQAANEVKAASPLGELLMKYAGVADDLPADMARNHDHYLYGTPKVAE